MFFRSNRKVLHWSGYSGEGLIGFGLLRADSSDCLYKEPSLKLFRVLDFHPKASSSLKKLKMGKRAAKVLKMPRAQMNGYLFV
jgi:hypothetical protein